MCLFDIEKLEKEAKELEKQSYEEDFWDDVEHAQKTMQDLNALNKQIDEYYDLIKAMEDLEVLIDLVIEEQAYDMYKEVSKELEVMEIFLVLI